VELYKEYASNSGDALDIAVARGVRGFNPEIPCSILNTLIISCYRPSAAVVAKYGEKSVYFDLEDIGNTTGQWDLYGSDAPSPYNPLQVSIT
jgi:hypothetical protein